MSTKESVLKALESLSGGCFVSGEELAKECQVSRVAIWKAIRSLEEEGYKIEAVSSKGYRILALPDKLSASEIQDYLSSEIKKELHIHTFREIDSTNSEAKRLAVETGSFRGSDGELSEKGKTAHLSLFASDSQTSGKGRLGRTFVSAKDCGVYFSLLYSPRGGVNNPALYTAAAAVAVVRALSKLYGEQGQIKWVNDVFLGGKKVCGILVEGIANFETGIIDAAVIGIGINVYQNKKLSGDITKIAGSIEEAKCNKGEAFVSAGKNKLIAEVVKNLIDFYEAFENADTEKTTAMINEYREASLLKGKKVAVNPVAGSSGQTYEATVKDIDEQMRLVVETESGEIRSLSSGEVSLHSYDFI